MCRRKKKDEYADCLGRGRSRPPYQGSILKQYTLRSLNKSLIDIGDFLLSTVNKLYRIVYFLNSLRVMGPIFIFIRIFAPVMGLWEVLFYLHTYIRFTLAVPYSTHAHLYLYSLEYFQIARIKQQGTTTSIYSRSSEISRRIPARSQPSGSDPSFYSSTVLQFYSTQLVWLQPEEPKHLIKVKI